MDSIPTTVIYVCNGQDNAEWVLDKKQKCSIIMYNADSGMDFYLRAETMDNLEGDPKKEDILKIAENIKTEGADANLRVIETLVKYKDSDVDYSRISELFKEFLKLGIMKDLFMNFQIQTEQI